SPFPPHRARHSTTRRPNQFAPYKERSVNQIASAPTSISAPPRWPRSNSSPTSPPQTSTPSTKPHHSYFDNTNPPDLPTPGNPGPYPCNKLQPPPPIPPAVHFQPALESPENSHPPKQTPSPRSPRSRSSPSSIPIPAENPSRL